MSNPYKGDVDLDIGGKRHTIRFDWQAISELKANHGPDILKTMIADPDPKLLAPITALALQAHHQGMTAEDVYKASPPIFPLIRALDQSLAFAYFGYEGVEESKKNPSTQQPNRKSRLMRLLKR